MNRRLIAILFFGLVALLTIAYWLIVPGSDWKVNLAPKSKEPYGTFVVSQLLDDYFPEKEFVSLEKFISKSLDTNDTGANYVYIQSNLFLEHKEIEALKKFVAKGNRAFIASFDLSDSLILSMYPKGYEDYWEGHDFLSDSVIKVSLSAPLGDSTKKLPIYVRDRMQKTVQNYAYLPNGDAWDLGNVALYELGTMNDSLCNFYGFAYGKGAFYIHNNPIVFSNYFLKDTAGFAYANGALSVLQRGKIYYDSRTFDNGGFDFDHSKFEKSPIQFVLMHPALAWAWYLCLGSLVLYLVFYAKRRQKPIEILAKPTNSALAFIKNMGALYLQKKNHKQIVAIQLRFFASYLMEKYKLLPRQYSSLDAQQKLAQLSGIELQQIKNLFRQIEVANHADQISEADLHQLYSAIEQFKTLAK